MITWDDPLVWQYGVPAALLVLAPAIGGLLVGVDRKLTARLQNRAGPPVVQPFYDVLKLFGKEDKIVNKAYLVFCVAYLATLVLSTAMLLFQYDLLVVAFVFGLSFIFLVLAGYSVRSQFSYVGSTRELMQMLAYEPILLLVVFLIRLASGSFEIESIYGIEPLLYTLPLALAALFLILPIQFRKSPYDIAEAHQEIAQGPIVEYTGKYLGLITLAHFYEVFFVLWFIGLFFVQNWAVRLGLMAMAFLAAIVVDNATARLRVDQMIKQVYIVGLILIILNLAYILLTNAWIAGGSL